MMLTIFYERSYCAQSHRTCVRLKKERCTVQTKRSPDKDTTLCCSLNLQRSRGISTLLAATAQGSMCQGCLLGEKKTWLALETVCVLMMLYLHKACFQKPEITTAAGLRPIFIYRVFPVHLVLFGYGCILPSSCLLAWFAAVVGKCREGGSEVIQVSS